jgi:hypothetical protein
MVFDRLFICLPDRSPLEPLLAGAAQFAALLPSYALEVVAAPAHALHDLHRSVVRTTFGRLADTVHLVPREQATVPFASAHAGPSSVIVTCPRDARRLPRGGSAAALVVPSDLSGRTVIALVDPTRDQPEAVTTALDLAARLSASRVLACDVFFNEAAIRCDRWEARVIAERQEQLDIFMTRVPSRDVPVDARLLHAPFLDRAVARLAEAEEAALVVSPRRVRLPVPVLMLPASSRPPAMGGSALWEALWSFALGRGA